MFSRMYLEITTCCNLSCSFCPGTKRPAAFLSPENFHTLAAKLRPYGEHLYLHVMGEPLLHPQLPQLLEICRELGFRATLTTNGTLLPKKSRKRCLLRPRCARFLSACTALRRMRRRFLCVSDRLHGVCPCGAKGRCSGGFPPLESRRRTDKGATRPECRNSGAAACGVSWCMEENTWGWRLENGVFVSFGERFDWPDEQAEERGNSGYCRALFDQIAVLSDGTVVPCCLDHEGTLALGNLFRQELFRHSRLAAGPRNPRGL